MARTKGAKNRLKPGDPRYQGQPGRIGNKLPSMSNAEMIDTKYAILQKLSSGEATTISDAARQLGIAPNRIYQWGSTDKEFKAAIESCKEVVADELETKLRESKNFIPWMFLLKAYRPEYRDNYRFDGVDSKMQEILDELKRKGEAPQPMPSSTTDNRQPIIV